MDFSLKSSTTTALVDRDVGMLLKPCNATASDHNDRLSSLPNELLSRILSLLPTKDAAATCSLSNRLRHAFPWITTLDFDASSISHCVTRRPYGIQHLSSFFRFVNTVLAAHQSQYLTKFKLRASVGSKASQILGCSGCYRPGGVCLPDLNSNLIHTWISFPFTRCGLKELDLCINLRVSQPDALLCNVQLPPAIFMCQTLESLKLDVNLALDQVYAMPSFCLPNLKLLHFRASLISDDSLVSRLLSSCPLLEDLVMEAHWHPYNHIRICSLSLRKLCFAVYRYSQDTYDNDFVLIDTPNLEDLRYFDEVGSSQYYFITNLDHLVKADIESDNGLNMRCFIRMFSNVKHLCLNGSFTEELNSVEVIDQLPMFHNLKYLELGCHGYVFWDMVVLAFLNRAPVLETLAFCEGIAISDDRSHHWEALELEQEFFRTAQVNIECCKFHLKRIVIQHYCGDEREVNLIWFLLRHSLVLEELVVMPLQSTQYELQDENSMKCTLSNLPKASTNCLIQVLLQPKALPIVPFN